MKFIRSGRFGQRIVAAGTGLPATTSHIGYAAALAGALFFMAAGALATNVPASAQTASAPAKQLHALFAQARRGARHGKRPAESPGYKQLWGDPSLAAVKQRTKRDKAHLAALKNIDFARLDPNDQLSYRLFEYQLKDSIEASKFVFGVNGPITQLRGPQLAGNQIKSEHFRNAKGYARLIRKLNATGAYLDAFTDRMKADMAKGYTQPRGAMQRVTDEIKANIVQDPNKSPFYVPFKALPDTIPAAQQAALREKAKKAITGHVNPAYARFLAFFKNDYLPHARTKIGASNLPDGKAYYAYLVRHYTTTDMTPEQVHELGLKLVMQIHGQMDALIKKIGFNGSFQQFTHYLRTNPRFYYTKPKPLLEAYEAAVERVNLHLPKVLGVWLMPRQPLGVEVIPASLAPNTYPAYANVPNVSVNLYKPQTRPKYSIQVLMCHEGRPGHNLQIPVADALTGLPAFRRFAYYNAFGEGWALYSETLCNNPLDLYDTPYAKFGYLNYQMWRAVRLVVDTGIHEDGWSKARAIKYMQNNTALADQNIDTEVARYIVWPGQALSYMIGEQTILRLRARAKKKLGDKYTLQDFDDAVIGQGSLPLTILKRVINRWINRTLAGTPADQLPYACKPRSTIPCASRSRDIRGLKVSQSSRINVLGQSVTVNYASGAPQKKWPGIRAAFASAAQLLDRHAGAFNSGQKDAVAAIHSVFVTAKPNACLGETGVHTMTLSDRYVQAVSVPWLASLFGHEGQHVLDAGKYTGANGWKDEQKASSVQLGIGRKIGFTKTQIHYLEHWMSRQNRVALQRHMTSGYPAHCTS